MKPPYGALKLIARLLTGEFRISYLWTLKTFLYNRKILVGRGFRIFGIRNIEIGGEAARVGLSMFGFASKDMPGLMRVRGSLRMGSRVMIANGNRWDIGPGAVVDVGAGTYFGPSTKIIISHQLNVGSKTAISWDCQFLDEDFHNVVNGRPSGAAIVIGDHVWIGSRVSILKGTIIGDGCIVAAGAVVSGDFSTPRTMIGGVPARVLRKDVDWR